MSEQFESQLQQSAEQLNRQLSEIQNNGFSDEFKCIIKNYYDNNNLLYLNEQIQKSNAVLNLHSKVFSKYKNINSGKDVVLVATGPTLKYYNPLEHVIHIGVNKAYKNEKLNLEYMFYQDMFSKTKQDIENFISYQENKTIKFLGILNDKVCPKSVIPESYCKGRTDVCRYYVEHPILYTDFTYDISSSILGDSYSIVFPTMQFILYTNPSKIYIVGCDCSDTGYFDGSVQQHTFTPQIIDGWNKLKNFVSIYYPEIEIISVNPVGLRGLFKDVHTESYLSEHPEIREELGENIEILNLNEVQNV